jgi:hypothetical protein
MFTRAFGLVTVALVLFSLAVEGGGGAQIKDKDTPKDQPKKKFAVPADAIAGKVKSVDLKMPSFTITASGKDRKFAVDAKTEFWGPKGGDRGTGPDGLKDDCMAVGYDIKVAASKDGKSATDVYLPNRKTDASKN